MLDQGVAKIFHMDDTRQYIYGKIFAYNAEPALIMEASVERTFKIKVAPQVGLEPTTLRLTAGCSTIELLRNA